MITCSLEQWKRRWNCFEASVGILKSYSSLLSLGSDVCGITQCLKIPQNVSFSIVHQFLSYQNWQVFSHFWLTLKIVNVARFARNVVKKDIFYNFQTKCVCSIRTKCVSQHAWNRKVHLLLKLPWGPLLRCCSMTISITFPLIAVGLQFEYWSRLRYHFVLGGKQPWNSSWTLRLSSDTCG